MHKSGCIEQPANPFNHFVSILVETSSYPRVFTLLPEEQYVIPLPPLRLDAGATYIEDAEDESLGVLYKMHGKGPWGRA